MKMPSNLYVTPEVWRKFKVYCAIRKIGMSDMLQQILEKICGDIELK